MSNFVKTIKPIQIVESLLGIALIVVSLAVLNMPSTRLTVFAGKENEPMTYYRRGMRFQYNSPGLAISNFTKAIELDPDFSEAYYFRASAYARLGNTDSALDDMTSAIELAPQTADYYFGRANLYKSISQTDLALADYDRAIELDPEDDAYYLNRGNTYYDLGEDELALADYMAFMKMHNNYDNFFMTVERRVIELDGQPPVDTSPAFSNGQFR